MTQLPLRNDGQTARPWGRHLDRALRTVACTAVVAWAIAGGPRRAGEPKDALASALSAQGLKVSSADVAWVDAPSGLGLGATVVGDVRAVVRAKAPGESQSDIWLVRTRRAPEGGLVEVTGLYRLTKTSVDETQPIVAGTIVAFATVAGGQTTGIELFDLAHEDPREIAKFTPLLRAQNAITNLQRTGSTLGVQRHRWSFDPPVTSAALRFLTDGALEILADGQRVVVEPGAETARQGAGLARFEPSVKARPGDLITWTVDRVRAVSWLGPQFIEWLEYRAFKARDFLKSKAPGLFAEDAAKQAASDLGSAKIKPTYTDPEIGFPPKVLTPLLSPGLPNEGVWLGTEDDPFVGKNPGLPSPFVQTFLRTDPQRSYARVYVTLWDPRQIALHMVAGTVEPVSATGEVGSGRIPRRPEVLSTLVAGFNGGFQAVHFEGGMQVEGVMYLPPKPYSATVAELRDGSTAFGTWPEAHPDVPEEVWSFRQNLVPLVQDFTVNPYKQLKWGGVPPGSTDSIHTTRAGLCVTRDDFVGYFFGNDMTPESMGRGMVAAGCRMAMHLDMNAGHTGFEFYRVAPKGELPDLARTLSPDWEAEGTVPQMPDWSFRARRMIKSMPHMLFPRYIGRDGRDFMYLTLRAVLPSAALVPRVWPALPGEGTWRVKGLPQHGFPYALATTKLRLDPHHLEHQVQLVQIDPHTVVAEQHGEPGHPPPARPGDGHDPNPNPNPNVVVTFGVPDGNTMPSDEGNAPRLWWTPNSFRIAAAPPDGESASLFAGRAVSEEALAQAPRLLGITTEGTLVITQGEPSGGKAMAALLASLGCTEVMIAPSGFDLRFGEALDVDGELAPRPLVGHKIELVRRRAPGVRLLFPNTPVVAPEVWQPMQAKRVRYFGKHADKPKPSTPP